MSEASRPIGKPGGQHQPRHPSCGRRCCPRIRPVRKTEVPAEASPTIVTSAKYPLLETSDGEGVGVPKLTVRSSRACALVLIGHGGGSGRHYLRTDHRNRSLFPLAAINTVLGRPDCPKFRAINFELGLGTLTMNARKQQSRRGPPSGGACALAVAITQCQALELC
jgi:hypothetical protein